MAFALALMIWVITLGTVILFVGRFWWFPEAISEHGPSIDRQFLLTLTIIGIAFVLAQMTLGVFIVRYRQRREGRASYWHDSPRLEALWTTVTAVVFLSLAVLGQRVWAKLHLNAPPPGALQVEVTAQQFVWNIRYPGPDGKFGRTRTELINDVDNPVGLDFTDPAARDDIVTVNQMAIPVNRDIHVILRSKDVIHSFWVPPLRMKQDAVPGLAINVHFKAVKTGQFEIACAELCGLSHHRMRGFLSVLSEPEFEAWLQQRASQ
jgi:cytochrome c oxidase subunit 2